MRKIRWRWLVLNLGMILALGNTKDAPLTQPITYDHSAQTVKQLLESLARQTGVRLFAPSPIDSEIVLVIVRDMPLKELMAHLATVADGEWFKQPDGSYHLVRTPKIIKERRQQDDEQLLRGLQRLLERKETKRLLEPLTEEQARQHRDKIKALMREVESQDINTPLWNTPYYRTLQANSDALLAGRRLVVRLLQKIDLRRLLEIPLGERRVFSNVPGRFLLPLGFSVEPLLQQFMRENELVYQLWTHPTEGLNQEWLNNFNNRYGYAIFDYWLRQKPLRRPPTRVYLVVRCHSPDFFTCSVALATDDLKESTSDGGFLWYFQVPLEEQEEEEEKTQPEQSQKPSESSSRSPVKVEWSERSRQFIEAYRAMERTTEAVPWPAILDPSQTEPLSLIPSDVLRTYAQHRGKALIALLQDDLTAGWIYLALQERRELDGFFDQRIRYLWDSQIQESDQVILFKPRLFSYRWGQRVDRAALMRWIEQVRQHGYLRLEDYLSASQFAENRGGINTLAWFYLKIIIERDLWSIDGLGARFLASLTPAQLAQLRAGQSLPLSAFTPAQRELLLRTLYFGETRLEVQWTSDEAPVMERDDEVIVVERPPIELIHAFYPNGLPAGLMVQLPEYHSTDQGRVGVFTQRRAGVWSGFSDLWQLAYEIYNVQTEQVSSWMNADILRYYRERVERYQSQPLMPARKKPFVVEIRLSERHSVRLPLYGELGDYELLNEGKPAPLDKLPEELKKQLDEQLKQLKESRRTGGL